MVMKMKKNNKNKKTNKKEKTIIYTIILTTLAIAIILIVFIIKGPIPTHTQELESTEKIEHYDSLLYDIAVKRYLSNAIVYNTSDEGVYLGITVDRWTNFGHMPQNAKTKRTIEIKNTYDKKIKYEIIAIGEVKPFIDSIPQKMTLKPNQEISANVIFDGKEIGNYTGEVNVILKIPKYKFLNWLI
jgi:hypothetical protein